MNSRLPSILAAIALAATGALAADQTGVGNAAGTTPGAYNTADRTFVTALGQGGMAEVDFARIAEQKSTVEEVKTFARRMVTDHTAANDKLIAIAKSASIPAPPDGLDPDHQSMQQALEKASGADFDRTYIQMQISEHSKTVQLLEYEVGSGQNAALKLFATDTLPVVREHLKMAQDINSHLTGSGAPATATAQ